MPDHITPNQSEQMTTSPRTSAIIFPHANSDACPVPLFVAAFIIQLERLHGSPATIRKGHIPIHLQANTATHLIVSQPEFIHSFDMLCRCLSGSMSTMQATDKFFAGNAPYVEKIENGAQSLYGTGKAVNAARLKDAAIDDWEKLADDEKEDLLAEAEAFLTADQDDENESISADDTFTASASLSGSPSCHPAPTPAAYIACHIQNSPMPVFYRKQLTHTVTGGWDEKLKAYFWPGPLQNYATSSAKFGHLIAAASGFTTKVVSGAAWTASDDAAAVAWANAVFTWGGVPQKNNTPQNVRAVIEAALAHSTSSSAPMNSGWTKIAAIASEHFPLNVIRTVIWDSRVSNAIISTLDPHFSPVQVPSIGIVAGRGGSRPRTFKSKWPSGYKSWNAQAAGSALIEDIRVILNSGSYPKMPLPCGGTSDWTTRGVEMVLFMFGY